MSGWSPKSVTGNRAGGSREAPICCLCRGASDPGGSCSSTWYPRHARCLLWAEPQTRRFWVVGVLAVECLSASRQQVEQRVLRSPGWPEQPQWIRQNLTQSGAPRAAGTQQRRPSSGLPAFLSSLLQIFRKRQRKSHFKEKQRDDESTFHESLKCFKWFE